MNKHARNIALLSAAGVFAACGLQSGSSRFGLDGVGDPRPPAGNIIPGKFHGTFEATRWNTTDPKITSLFGGSEFSVVQGLFSATPVEGLAGLGLLVISTTPPPRLTGVSNCYEDLGIGPQLGGTLNFVDVGTKATLKAGTTTIPLSRDADDTIVSPAVSQLIYLSPLSSATTIPYGTAEKMTWAGGTLAGKGFDVAPPRTDPGSVLAFPVELISSSAPNPLVNGVDMMNGAAPIPASASGYTLRWTPSNAATSMGVEVVVQVYGPVNLPTNVAPVANNDLPYFNKLGQLVCLASEVDGASGFRIEQAMLDRLVADVKTTNAYAASTEDVNGNGVVDAGEDGNGNGRLDKIYGAVLILNRRAENTFGACLQGASDCVSPVPVFISGNATKMNHMAFLPAE